MGLELWSMNYRTFYIYYLLRTTLIPWYRASYVKMIVAHLVKKLPAFTKPEDSSTFQPLTQPEPTQSSSHSHTLFF